MIMLTWPIKGIKKIRAATIEKLSALPGISHDSVCSVLRGENGRLCYFLK